MIADLVTAREVCSSSSRRQTCVPSGLLSHPPQPEKPFTESAADWPFQPVSRTIPVPQEPNHPYKGLWIIYLIGGIIGYGIWLEIHDSSGF